MKLLLKHIKYDNNFDTMPSYKLLKYPFWGLIFLHFVDSMVQSKNHMYNAKTKKSYDDLYDQSNIYIPKQIIEIILSWSRWVGQNDDH